MQHHFRSECPKGYLFEGTGDRGAVGWHYSGPLVAVGRASPGPRATRGPRWCHPSAPRIPVQINSQRDPEVVFWPSVFWRLGSPRPKKTHFPEKSGYLALPPKVYGRILDFSFGGRTEHRYEMAFELVSGAGFRCVLHLLSSLTRLKRGWGWGQVWPGNGPKVII